MSRPTLVIDQGLFFPSAMRILFVFVGFFLSIFLIGLPILAMAIYHVGTEVDMDRSCIREYGSILGMRWGKWKPIDPYKAIVILGKRRVSTMYSRSQQSIDSVEYNHDVTLVDRTHRRKFLLKACDTAAEASALADQVADHTGLPIERYAPERIVPRRR